MSKLKKVLVSAIVVLALVAVATPASAQTYSWSRALKQGSVGADVMSLQKFLNLCSDTQVSLVGAGSPGMESSNFGPATKAAVIKFQVKHGIYPSAGYFGPLTQAKVAMLLSSGNPCGTGSGSGSLPAGCVPGAMYSSTTGQPCSGGSNPSTPSGLSGGAGDLESAEFISSVSNEDVGEDEENVQVLGLELEADNGSDLSFTSIRLEFEEQAAGGSDELEDYADEVTVWLGSTKVGSADVSDFDEDDGVYTETITLSNAIVRKGQTGKLYVAVTSLSNIDSDDLGSANNDWRVGVANLRYVDAQGAVVTENTLDDIGVDLATATTGSQDFQFVSFASAADVELNVSLNTDEDDVNDAHTITVDEDDETDNEPLLAFTLEAEGDSDITVMEIPVKFTTNDSNLSTVISEVTLYHGTTEIASEDVDGTSTSETITFEDLDIEIGSEDEEEFWVKATILEQDGNYTSGTATIRAEITSTLADAIEAEDETGEELGTSELTGAASADAHTLDTTAATVTVTSKESDQNEAGTLGTFTFNVTITAEEGDVDVDAASIVETLLGPDNTPTSNTLSVVNLDGDATENGSNDYTVEDGESNTFAISYSLDPDTNGTYYIRLDSIDGVIVDVTSSGENLSAS